MKSIATQDDDETRTQVWHVARRLVTAAAALLLVTFFLAQATSTEAAAPVPSADTAVYHEMAACPAGFNCAANSCIGANYLDCSYNLGWIGANYPINYQVGLIGGRYIPSTYIAANYCPSGNFTACYNNLPTFIGGNYCPSGNFTACNAATTTCPSGNYTCYNSNFPWIGANFSNGAFPWNGAYLWNGGFPYGYTGKYSGNTTIVVPNRNITVVGPPVFVKEVAQPAATTVTAAPVAAPAPAVVEVAPAAPAAGMATALTVPSASPDGGAGVVTAFSAPPAATGVQVDFSDRG